MPRTSPTYEEDFYGWIQATTALLKQGHFREVDMDHVIEEMEDMARSERHQLVNRLAVLIAHLLKWQFQPNLKGHSWLYTITEQRKQIKIHLRENPSLKSHLDLIMEDAYDVALSKAAKETSFSEKHFPMTCPYTFEQCMDVEFFPGGELY